VEQQKAQSPSSHTESWRANPTMTNDPDCCNSSSNNSNTHTYKAMAMVEISECREVKPSADPCYDYGDQQMQ
jgi:hypothetical protein